MPNGKPTGVRCIHLTDDFCSAIFTEPDRPNACAAFQSVPEFCCDTRNQALQILSELETITLIPITSYCHTKRVRKRMSMVYISTSFLFNRWKLCLNLCF